MLAETTNLYNIKFKQVAMLAMDVFMKAIYNSNNYARQDKKEKLRKLYK